MYIIYMDSGTSNTRAYLIDNNTLVSQYSMPIGTKDSAVSGSNAVLIEAMKKCYDELIARNNLQESDIAEVWVSGMVTNPFGVLEVPHVSTPVDSRKLLDTAYQYFEATRFHRDIYLIRGAKTAQPEDVVTMDNIDRMNNVRGEEIEAVGIASTGIVSDCGSYVMISPGSHTHLLYIQDGAVIDIVSNFTGELTHAIKKETILGGELSSKDVVMEKEYVIKGYESLKTYGLCRALYIIHGTNVFHVCTNEVRSQMLAGIISGSVVDILHSKLCSDWKNVKKIIILSGKNYVASLQILCNKIIPNIEVTMISDYKGNSLALCGFLELLKIRNKEYR